MNPRPRLSSADVLTTTPSGRPRNNAAELKALWLTGLPTNFSVFTGADWSAPVKTLKFVGRPVSHKALSSAALLRGRPDGVVVNTSALESRGRGFKSRSGQFLGFSLCVYIYIYIYIYIYETTKILEIRLADISSLLVKDFVRATDQAARAVTICTLIGNVRRSTVKIREHMWAVTTVTIFALNKINVKR